MTRLIDADALLPMMKYATTDSEIGVFPIKIGFNAITKVIDDAPTVDAVPARHGRWLDITESHIGTCSLCGDRWGSVDVMNYCPNCGARMDEK